MLNITATTPLSRLTLMAFAERRRIPQEQGPYPEGPADAADSSLIQINRHVGGNSLPNLEAIRKLSAVLGGTADELVFDLGERGPDDELRRQFEAVSRFRADEKKTAKDVLDGLILKHEARRWASSD